jgi:hypothetical protein
LLHHRQESRTIPLTLADPVIACVQPFSVGRRTILAPETVMIMRLLLVPVLMCVSFSASAQTMPEMPKPVKEHEWLKKFVGDWTGEGKAEMPGVPGVATCTNTETVKSFGGFWIQSEMKGKFGPMEMSGQMTVGYDPEKKKYVGTWIDTMSSFMWKYEGTLSDDGKTLTLESTGPSCVEPGKMAKYKDVTEFKSDDHKVFSSWMEGADGKWTRIMTMECKKKK